jgi:hypothetical protein
MLVVSGVGTDAGSQRAAYFAANRQPSGKQLRAARMSDNNIIPIGDEQAKLGQEIVKASRATGGYLADILGDLPKDLVGLLAGDRVKAWRAERLAITWDGVKRRLKNREITEPEPPSLKLALPILAAAADETSEELRELWESLLAAAMDPNRRDLVRLILIETVKKMDLFDVLVFRAIVENPSGNWSPSGRDFMVGKLGRSQDEVLVSFDNLERLGLIWFVPGSPKINPVLQPLGKVLIRAVA